MIVRALPTPAVLLGPDARVHEANDRFVELVGMVRGELRGAQGHAGWWMDEPALTGLLTKVCSARAPAALDGAAVAVDGRPIPMRIDAAPVRDADGSPLALCLLTDRSAEHRLAQRLRAAVDGGMDGLMVFTMVTSGPQQPADDAVLADANPRAADMLGLRLGAALGRPLSVLVDAASTSALVQLFNEALRAGDTVEDTRRVSPTSGTGELWVRLRATPLGGDEVVLTARDTTEERALDRVVDAALELLDQPTLVTRLASDATSDSDDAVVVHLDPHAALALGIPRDTAAGTPLSRVLDGEALARVLAAHRAAIADGEPRAPGDYPVDASGPGTGWSLIPTGDGVVMSTRRTDRAREVGVDIRAVMEASPASMVVIRLVRDDRGRPVDGRIEAIHIAGHAGPAAGVGQGDRLVDLVEADDLPGVLADLGEAARTGGPVERMRRLRLRDAGTAVHRYALRYIPAGGDVFAVSWRDMSDEEVATNRLRRAIEGGLDGFQIIEMVRDADGRIVDGLVVEANDRVAAEMGTTRARHLGTRVSETAGPSGVGRTVAEYEQVLRDRRPLERERPFTLPGVGTRWMRYQLLPLDDAVVVLSRDVTDRRRAEDELRRMAEQLSFVARHSSETISLHARDGRFQFASDGSRRVWGHAPGDLLGRSGLDFVHPDDREHVAECMRRIDQEAGQEQLVTMRVVRPDGSAAPLDTSIRAIRDAAGRLEAFLWVSRDAGPRLEAERRSAERLQESARRAAEQAALRRVATTAAGESAVHSVLEVAAREAALLLEADVGLVARFVGGAVVVAGTSRPDLGPARDETVPTDRLPALAAVARWNSHSRAEGADTDGEPTGYGFRSSVAAPVRVDGRLWGGILTATVGERRLESGAEVRLERFAEIIELALAAAEARERLAAQAVTDALTGLANHRAFHERLRAELARGERHGRPVSLAIMDIDHFKRLNDIHGHLVGDQVLAEVARRLQDVSRSGETIARIGGEEFGWILPETDARGALEAVERARRAVSETPAWGDVAVTISGGVADTLDAPGADDLFRLADSALYSAKAAGRNVAFRFTPESTQTLTPEDRAAQLERSRAVTALRSLARAVDAKAPATHAHSDRVAALAQRIAEELGWGERRAAMLRDAALLHDVGKIGVPDAVLLRPGPLAEDEMEVVRRHAALSAEIVSDALTPEQRGWILHHHERWDGRGYPGRLAGDGIPEGARIIAVADAWDSMTVARHHEEPFTFTRAEEELRRCAGTQFWPPAVEALTRVQETAERT